MKSPEQQRTINTHLGARCEDVAVTQHEVSHFRMGARCNIDDARWIPTVIHGVVTIVHTLFLICLPAFGSCNEILKEQIGQQKMAINQN